MNVPKLLELLLVVGLTSCGQLLMRLGMRTVNADMTITDVVLCILRTPLLWLALAFYGVSTLLWLRMVGRYPIGSIYPMVAIGYVMVVTGGTLFLGERVPWQGWLALAVICAGTLLLAAAPWQSAR